jgi:acetolactate synthase-1/2/3 large subunit
MEIKENNIGTKLENITGAEAVIRSLVEEEVEILFGYPGGAIMPVYDALYDYQDKLKHILVRHEQGAVHAAQGYARASGKVGVCLATSGPGATNLITGLADAMIDSTPVVCITGQVASHLLGTDAFQETDVVGVSMPVTKWNIQVTKPEEIPQALAKAFYIARSGRPGPVVVDITKNAQFGSVDFGYSRCEVVRSYIPKPLVQEDSLERAANLINQAKKPFLLVGQGVILSRAEDALKKLVEKADIPYAWTLLGLSAMPTDHYLNMGMLGMHGNYGPNVKTNECDVLIAVGMRFDDRVTGDVSRYAKQAKIIHIEIDPAEVNKNVVVDVPVIGDAREVLERIVDRVDHAMHLEWRKEFAACKSLEFDKVVEKAIHPDRDHGLLMGEVVTEVSSKLNGDAILVTDVGQHQMAASRYFRFGKTRSNVTSGGLGTMGFALPAGLGAKLGAPERDVVIVVGDGGIQMNIQELATIFQYGIGVKILLLNNNFLGMVRQWQQLFFDRRYSFTEMSNPDFVKVAEGFGIPSAKAADRHELEESIEKMLNAEGPYLLEVVVEKEENVFPMIPTGSSVSEMLLE